MIANFRFVVASGGTFVVSRLLIHLSQSDWWCGQCWCLVMSFFTFGWSIDYCHKNGMAQLHVCCCMYTCCMYAGPKFAPVFLGNYISRLKFDPD